ncbi:LytR/AlgR family response regulator transcription factor [Hymenobacter cellulosivorans]|uniref:LytTR family DNA-binding domain-containing protein n=1 Tax=Hymenobacter cellulosivorans TaxID=2932249 RepID=A0ABY4FHV2_9BACT|nr:LytTR family DNA-binding domain-containing protein [Hymenobacter cellulosivorans]UOQ55587.1 LytTR family DNA-binding domain-containing protein [Hymenobacter cellulosivorans]
MRIVVVEDEQLAADKLVELIRAYDPASTIVACLDSVADTVAWLSTHAAPDLLFLDIHLADGLGFEIFAQTAVPCPVVFTTAFDQYAIQAFRVNSIDYLLKPLTPRAVADAFRKYEALRRTLTPAPPAAIDYLRLLDELRASEARYKARFLVRAGQRIKTIAAAEVAYFFAEDKYTYLVTGAGPRYVVDFTLDDLEERLDPALFFRLNRKFLASLPAIHEIHAYFKGRLKLTLSPPVEAEVLVSSERAAPFKSWLDR